MNSERVLYPLCSWWRTQRAAAAPGLKLHQGQTCGNLQQGAAGSGSQPFGYPLQRHTKSAGLLRIGSGRQCLDSPSATGLVSQRCLMRGGLGRDDGHQ